MFKYNLKLDANSNLKNDLSLFCEALGRARIEARDAAFLQEQVIMTIQQFEKQLGLPNTKTYRADRVFQGNGYRVTISVNPPRGFLAKIIDALKK
jgi:hypothetical protein